jgi:hypothetical protein
MSHRGRQEGQTTDPGLALGVGSRQDKSRTREGSGLPPIFAAGTVRRPDQGLCRSAWLKGLTPEKRKAIAEVARATRG